MSRFIKNTMTDYKEITPDNSPIQTYLDSIKTFGIVNVIQD